MAQAMLDTLGWTYIGLATAWTVSLILGMLFLHHRRHLPCLQIRRVPLVFVCVSSLHAYGAACTIVYVIGPLVSCTAEFWLMSIYLPFGIAMFHAANSQFLHIASRQKQFTHMRALSNPKPVDEKKAGSLANSRFRRILRGVERADKIDRMMVWIGVGLVAQLAVTLFVFFGSRKFHTNYGIFDYTVNGTATEIRMKCTKGWEWWLSIVWQFFWAWVYAPYMLWKSRGIRDVHGWRVQTVCCCLAGLPASPLWLAGLYAPQMATVNAYFPPPMWFAVSIFLMEVFTIVFPIIQVLKAESLRQETLDALSKWERQQELKKGQDSVSGSESRSNKSSNYTGTTLSMDEQLGPTKYTTLELQSTDMLNMIALENTLRVNPEPLLQFAALKDFSGENVSFLTHVAEWKRAWFVPLRSTKEQRERQFMDAVRIYACFVSLIFAPFPINISSRELDRLRDLFEGKAERLMRRTSSYAGSSDTITPFDLELTETASTTEFKSGADLDKFGRAKLKSASGMAEFVTGRESPIDGIEVPEAFTADVFESAEREIKYLIFTNTWPKFVGASCASSDSEVKEAGRARWWARATLCNV